VQNPYTARTPYPYPAGCARQVADIEKAEKDKMADKVKAICGHGINCFVNRQLVYNYPEELFADAGIMAIEHADFDGIERLALVTGALSTRALHVCLHVCMHARSRSGPEGILHVDMCVCCMSLLQLKGADGSRGAFLSILSTGDRTSCKQHTKRMQLLILMYFVTKEKVVPICLPVAVQ
jgi:hypothetical protein